MLTIANRMIQKILKAIGITPTNYKQKKMCQ